jgi:hypothetical protein
MFILLGRDRHAPLLVRLWALLRHRADEDDGKVAEAIGCAELMVAYANGLDKPALVDRLRTAAPGPPR